jgi:hypothetical protein
MLFTQCEFIPSIGVVACSYVSSSVLVADESRSLLTRESQPRRALPAWPGDTAGSITHSQHSHAHEDPHHQPRGRSRQEPTTINLGAALAQASWLGIASRDYRTLIVDMDP